MNRLTLKIVIAAVVVTATSLLVACGQLTPGAGEGYSEDADQEYAHLDDELLIRFESVLRPSQFRLAFDRGPSGERKYVSTRGSIPVGSAVVDRKDICDRRKEPNCVSFAFGEEILREPLVRAQIEDWFLHLCSNLPANPGPSAVYYTEASRRREVHRLRVDLGCDGGKSKPRSIHLHVVRNFDQVFNGDSAHTERALRPAIVETRVLYLN